MHFMEFNTQEYHQRLLSIPLIQEVGLKKLTSQRVLVVGAGGLGSHVLPHLAGAGIGVIGICEFDAVAMNNLHRQHLYSFYDIGKPKLHLAIERLQSMNPSCKFIPHSEKFSDSNADQLLKDYNLIIDCTDNIKTRFELHDACLRNRKDMISGAVHQEEGTVSFYHFSKMPSPCLRCLWGDLEQIHQHRPTAVMSPLVGVIGSIMSNEIIRYSLELPTLEQGVTLQFDQSTYQLNQMRWNARQSCRCTN